MKACQIIRYLVDAEVGIRVKVVVFRGHILRGRFCRAFPLRNLAGARARGDTHTHTHQCEASINFSTMGNDDTILFQSFGRFF